MGTAHYARFLFTQRIFRFPERALFSTLRKEIQYKKGADMLNRMTLENFGPIGRLDWSDLGPVNLVSEALEHGMAGATVFRALLSFGLRHKVHASKIFELAGELPVVIEIVDTTEKIEGVLLAIVYSVKQTSNNNHQ